MFRARMRSGHRSVASNTQGAVSTFGKHELSHEINADRLAGSAYPQYADCSLFQQRGQAMVSAMPPTG